MTHLLSQSLSVLAAIVLACAGITAGYEMQIPRSQGAHGPAAALPPLA